MEGHMSAQAIQFRPGIHRYPYDERLNATEDVNDSGEPLSGAHFEVLYQALFAPAPTPEEIAREDFLLDCD
jgi:hypothetical protein